MNTLVHHLRDHYWKNLCDSLGVGYNLEVFELLDKQYSNPSRFYHGWNHIADCLKNLDEVRDSIPFKVPTTECAIFFHDAIYDSRRKDNEIESAALSSLYLVKMGVGDYMFTENVASFIKASTHRYLSGPTSEMNLFLDIDLASLGYPLETFKHNTSEIRQEHDWVPTDVFIKERTKMLESFLKRPTIYYTDFFRDKYETQARLNLSHPILL